MTNQFDDFEIVGGNLTPKSLYEVIVDYNIERKEYVFTDIATKNIWLITMEKNFDFEKHRTFFSSGEWGGCTWKTNKELARKYWDDISEYIKEVDDAPTNFEVAIARNLTLFTDISGSNHNLLAGLSGGSSVFSDCATIRWDASITNMTAATIELEDINKHTKQIETLEKRIAELEKIAFDKNKNGDTML